jgi:hypothetical protein
MDAYVRDGDLVGTYAAADNWPFASQLYWRAERFSAGAEAIASLCLLVSIQTDLLDTHPQLAVVSQWPADEMISITAATGEKAHVETVENSAIQLVGCTENRALLWRSRGMRFSYAEFALASDFQQLEVSPAGADLSQARWRLFSEFLEKGVIRRAQIHAALLPREQDIELATSLCERLMSRPLPLTT